MGGWSRRRQRRGPGPADRSGKQRARASKHRSRMRCEAVEREWMGEVDVRCADCRLGVCATKGCAARRPPRTAAAGRSAAALRFVLLCVLCVLCVLCGCAAGAAAATEKNHRGHRGQTPRAERQAAPRRPGAAGGSPPAGARLRVRTLAAALRRTHRSACGRPIRPSRGPARRLGALPVTQTRRRCPIAAHPRGCAAAREWRPTAYSLNAASVGRHTRLRCSGRRRPSVPCWPAGRVLASHSSNTAIDFAVST